MQVTLYPYQSQSVDQLLAGKHIIKADPGTGKTAVLFSWLEQNNATHIIIATTAAKAHEKSFQAPSGSELIKFTSPEFRARLASLEVVSWHMLKKWCDKKTPQQLADYYFVADECQFSKGITTQMGRAFIYITKHCKAWTGFSATPGDTWMDYCSYFIAANKVKHKTQFVRDYTISQHYPFPMVLGYQHEDTLKEWWQDISYEPDTSAVLSQLPPVVHQVMKFPAPKGYKKVEKTSTTLEGEFLESNMDLYHHLRQMCDTKDKQDALSDLLASLSSTSPIVVFYNYKCERDSILAIATKLKRKVWRIDGERHEIPTEGTIGADDIVLCHYLSGSAALNLQFVHYWLSYSYNWSYSTTRQAIGRVQRIGQKADHVFYYWLRCEGTVEDDVAKALSKKQDFQEELFGIDKKQSI